MKLIICADDFGQSEAIDLAIIQLIEMNRLTATSCMTLSPRWPEAAKKLTPSIKTKASIGLHLDLTHFDFASFGKAISHQKLVLLSLSRQLSSTTLSQSIHHQLDRFEDEIGYPPDYVDGHQHVHQLPQIRECLFEALLKRYPQQLPWLRLAKPPMRDGFNGTSEVYLEHFKSWLKQVKANANTPILMCHPAIKMPFNEDDVIYSARVKEFEVLASNLITTELKKVNLVKSPIN